MKRILFVVFPLLMLVATLMGQNSELQKGTIIRMHMAECLPEHHFIARMSGDPAMVPVVQCPEYVLMTDKVVYAISGRSSNQLLPLAEVTRFRMQNGEILIRIDDERKESHFHVKAMVLRSDWEREHMEEEEVHAASEGMHGGEAIAVNHRLQEAR